MGIVGWADAPNEADNDDQLNTAFETPSSSTDSLEVSEQIDELEQVNEGSVEEDQSEYSVEYVLGEEGVAPTLAGENERVCSPELIEAVHQLRLNKKSDDPGIVDISKFELHEIMFLYEHAASMGLVNEYDFVRELFAVKHRIMESVEDIDSVSSPNLDELLEFAEDKYAQSISEAL